MNDLTFARLQQEQKDWAYYNFGVQPPHRSLLGLSEEVGELCHAHLKMEQGIRGNPLKLHLNKVDAVGDILIYLAGYCNDNDIDLQTAIETAWSQVKSRDWIKYPENGHTA